MEKSLEALSHEEIRLGQMLTFRNLQARRAMDWAKEFTKSPSAFATFELGVWEEANEEGGEATKRMLDGDEWITCLQLFPRPSVCQEVPWTKPEMYLACALADKGLRGADLQEALGAAARCKSAGRRYLYT